MWGPKLSNFIASGSAVGLNALLKVAKTRIRMCTASAVTVTSRGANSNALQDRSLNRADLVTMILESMNAPQA
jgi:hypothetical protein